MKILISVKLLLFHINNTRKNKQAKMRYWEEFFYTVMINKLLIGINDYSTNFQHSFNCKSKLKTNPNGQEIT